jgi:drug/metabolite transporter (DMT)-like permease
MFEWLWALFTVAAAGAQTARNAMQRGLTGRLGTVGATHVRFLYGAPFAWLFSVVVRIATGETPPAPGFVFLGWCVFGGVMQIAATALMLAAMRERSFVVTIAYTKTEPVQVALFAVVVLGETLTPFMAAAILVATAGVMVMSWPPRDEAGEAAFSWRPVLMGVAAGGVFALAAVGFRGAVLEMRALGAESFVTAATTTLVYALSIQAALLSAYLAVRDRAALVEVVKAWRVSVVAGLFGALASQMWFLAFALEQVARVRTLGLVEVLFAWAVSRNLMKQRVGAREAAGIALLILGVAAVLNA